MTTINDDGSQEQKNFLVRLSDEVVEGEGQVELSYEQSHTMQPRNYTSCSVSVQITASVGASQIDSAYQGMREWAKGKLIEAGLDAIQTHREAF